MEMYMVKMLEDFVTVFVKVDAIGSYRDCYGSVLKIVLEKDPN